MHIYIVSRGRPHKQRAAEALKAAGIKFQIVVALNDKTLPEYRALWGKYLKVLDVQTLAEKRTRLLAGSPNKMVMVDDDLTFFARRGNGSFMKADNRQIREMFRYIQSTLNGHAHVGLVDKFMSQAQPRGYKTGGRYNQVLAYNALMIRQRARKLKVPTPMFRLPLNHDHDMNLQLMNIGLAPIICCEYSKDAKYYADGGLKKFRTIAKERKSFKTLAKLWPEYVKLRETKHSISGIAATFKWRVALDDCRLVNAQVTGVYQ